jgi:hypothetical protein
MKTKTPFQNQLRAAIESCGKNHEAICRETGIQKATFSRFMHAKGGLSVEGLDRLTECIGLEIKLKGK